jgi:glycosyltransferase involved in cell wall biosynthesis
VASDVPGCREVVRNGYNGLLVPPRSAEALAHAINLLLKDPALRAQMGVRGKETAVEKFSEDKVIAATLSVYRTVMSCCDPGGQRP